MESNIGRYSGFVKLLVSCAEIFYVTCEEKLLKSFSFLIKKKKKSKIFHFGICSPEKLKNLS